MLIFDAELEQNKVWAIALARRLATFGPDVDFEIEGQIAKHSGSSNPTWSTTEVSQDHWELNALANVRWNRFFWDRYVDTSAALGLGVSYATKMPGFEVKAHGASNRLMAYILVEVDFSLPEYPQWALVSRIHHRSAAWGTFEDDIESASNAFGLGLKYRF